MNEWILYLVILGTEYYAASQLVRDAYDIWRGKTNAW